MSQTVCILGRQPKLGLAELESIFDADSLQPIGSSAVILTRASEEVPYHRLGGVVKLCRLLTELPYTDWSQLEEFLIQTVPQHLQYIPEGKIRFGLSTYGFSISAQRLNATGLSVKKVIRAAGRSVRVVPNKTMDLSTAQTMHNQLTGPTGLELVLVADGSRTILAQVVASQDIDAYTIRDRNRPKRDARVGMLPPKLAQTIINLVDPQLGDTILDPFCGTGVLLQEALLMGFSTYGTDLEPRMVDYTKTNLDWLTERFGLAGADYMVELGDAMQYRWTQPFAAVAAETYLGRPLNKLPAPDVLQKIMNDCDFIHRKFLANIAGQIASGTRLCLAVPAWKKANAGTDSFWHLPVLDSLEELGYTRTSFVHADTTDLIYHREDQVVGRELVTLIRK